MSDFLERLARRAVSPTVRVGGAAPLEPRLPGRFESPSPHAPEDDAADLVEEHVEVRAPATRLARVAPRRGLLAPSSPPPAAPAPAPPRPADATEARSGSSDHEEALTPVVPPSVAAPPPTDLAVPGARPLAPESEPSPTRDLTPDLPAPSPSAAQEPVRRGPARPQRPPPATVLEPVIEVHQVPVAPPAVPAPPSARGRPRRAEGPFPAPNVPLDPERAPAAVVFEPREPLAPLRLEPLAEHEVLTVPALADVATPESVVHVHIGRLEVSRPAPVPPPAPAPRRRAPTLSLDEYLTQRTAGVVDGGYRR